MGIPRVNWPGESGAYKAIQMYVDRMAYLRFGEVPDDPESRGDRRKPYFNLILMRALHDFGIFFKGVYPAPVGERYNVVGMWRFQVDVGKKVVRPLPAKLVGRNTHYNVGIDRVHLEAIFGLEREWRLVNSVYVPMRTIVS